MRYQFNCPFCNLKYIEHEGLYYSELLSKKSEVNLKCKNCKERFTLTVNMYADLVTYKNQIIKNRKEYNRIKKKESRSRRKRINENNSIRN